MSTQKTLIAILLCGIFSTASAAGVVPDGKNAAARSPLLTQIRFEGLEQFALGKVVKNAPYTAEAVSERVQTLSDGNQITSTQTSINYRDSAGRTRQEIQNAKGELVTIRIHDPVEAVSYVLNVRQKTAVSLARPESGAPLAAARDRVQQLRKEEIVIKRVQRSDGGADAPLVNDLDGRIKAVISGAMGDMRWARQATVKDLGSKEFDGIKARGKLRSYDIPAGEVGNRNPITVTQENWLSPELQITLYSKHNDPRTGERSYRLAGVKREEPAAALFTVPSDYTFKEAAPQRKPE